MRLVRVSAELVINAARIMEIYDNGERITIWFESEGDGVRLNDEETKVFRTWLNAHEEWS